MPDRRADHLDRWIYDECGYERPSGRGDFLGRVSRREPYFGFLFVPTAIIATVVAAVALARQQWWVAAVAAGAMLLTYPVVWRRFRILAREQDSADRK